MNKICKLMLFSLVLMIVTLSCSDNGKERIGFSGYNVDILKEKALLLPNIEIDSVRLNRDSLIVHITDKESTILDEVLIDQYIKILFQDYSLTSSADFTQVKVNYQIPERDSLGYFEIMNISLNDLKESLVLFTNKSFREIIDTITFLQKEHSQINLLEKLNFYSNQVLYEEKRIDFQLFGVNFLDLIPYYLVECESKNGDDYQKIMERIILSLDENKNIPDKIIPVLRNVFDHNCNYLKTL